MNNDEFDFKYYIIHIDNQDENKSCFFYYKSFLSE